MIRKLFEKLCLQKRNRTFALTLYSKSIWLSVNYILMRLKELSSIIRYIPHALIHERVQFQIDGTYELPVLLSSLLTDNQMWKDIAAAHSTLDHACKFIGVLANLLVSWRQTNQQCQQHTRADYPCEYMFSTCRR